MNPEFIFEMFEKLGLKPPRRLHFVFGDWSDEGLEIDSSPEPEDEPQFRCRCCDCYLQIGPPGCDGTDCRSCGRC
jgi:hypothetical protein